MALGLWLAAPWLAGLAAPLALAVLIAAGGLGFLLLGHLVDALDFREMRRAMARR